MMKDTKVAEQTHAEDTKEAEQTHIVSQEENRASCDVKV